MKRYGNLFSNKTTTLIISKTSVTACLINVYLCCLNYFFLLIPYLLGHGIDKNVIFFTNWLSVYGIPGLKTWCLHLLYHSFRNRIIFNISSDVKYNI